MVLHSRSYVSTRVYFVNLDGDLEHLYVMDESIVYKGGPNYGCYISRS